MAVAQLWRQQILECYTVDARVQIISCSVGTLLVPVRELAHVCCDAPYELNQQ